jgi:uncharacterized membrane protein YfcA
MVVLLAGLLAGVITSVAGMGGGLVLLLVLGLWLDDPLGALVVTSPALLLGNLHRAWSLRREAVPTVFLPLALAAVPTSFLVARWVVDAPVQLLRWALFAVALLAGLRGVGVLSWIPSHRWAVPVGVAAGAIQSTAGGSGVVLAPYLLGRGLSGAAYVGTMASVAVALHLSRLLAFGSSGLVDGSVVGLGLLLAVAIVVGNHLGLWLGRGLSPAVQRRVQVGALVGAAGLAAAGV